MKYLRIIAICVSACFATCILFAASSWAEGRRPDQLHVLKPLTFEIHDFKAYALLAVEKAQPAELVREDFSQVSVAAAEPLKPEYAESYDSDGLVFHPHRRE